MGKDHDDHLLERLLDGRLPADDVPQDLAGAGRLLAAARAVPPADPVVERATVAAMVEVVHSSSQPTPLSRRSPVLAGLLTTKAAVVVAVLTLSATGAAAATGSVPDPVVAFLDDIGIQVPANPVKVVQTTTTTTSTVVTRPAASPISDEDRSTAADSADGSHGDDVSDVARATEPGPCHGKTVSEAARDHDDDESTSTSSTSSTSTTIDDHRRLGDCDRPTSTVVRPADDDRRGKNEGHGKDDRPTTKRDDLDDHRGEGSGSSSP